MQRDPALQLAQQGVQIAAVDPQAPAERDLTRRALLGQRAENGEVLAAMHRCLRDGTAPPVSADDAVRGLEVLDAARESAQTDVVVRVGKATD